MSVTMGGSINKKNKEKQRAKARQEKEEKMQARKQTTKKGKTLEEMMVYLDEEGNLSSTPPDPRKAKVFNQEDMVIGVPKIDKNAPDVPRTGIIDFFNHERGFGFIKDTVTGQSLFVHVNDISGEVTGNNKVAYEVGHGFKGPCAVNVRMI